MQAGPTRARLAGGRQQPTTNAQAGPALANEPLPTMNQTYNLGATNNRGVPYHLFYHGRQNYEQNGIGIDYTNFIMPPELTDDTNMITRSLQDESGLKVI